MQLKILYVEDNKVNAIVMDKMLSQEDTHILIAENGKEAINIAQENELDLILLDINLGKNQMDGCEVLKKLQELKIASITPIFAVTAYAMPGDEKHFKSIGFDQYFSKPVNFPQLRSEIKKLKL